MFQHSQRLKKYCISFALMSATLVALSHPVFAMTRKITVLAAENFYGNIAEQIGKKHIDVKAVLNNPDQDPHLFEVTPSIAKKIRYAEVVIYNGLGYDQWMNKLLASEKNPRAKVINVGQLLGKKMGDNPHIWYSPETMPTLAKTLAQTFSEIDPKHRDDYQQNLKQFLSSLAPLNQTINTLRQTNSGIAVTATEPVFDEMANALGFKMLNPTFQLAIMNNTEPSAKEIAAFEHNLKEKKVRLLILNEQVIDPAVKRLVQLSQQSGIPVVRVTETQPAGLTYANWMLTQLKAIQQALQNQPS